MAHQSLIEERLVHIRTIKHRNLAHAKVNTKIFCSCICKNFIFVRPTASNDVQSVRLTFYSLNEGQNISS